MKRIYLMFWAVLMVMLVTVGCKQDDYMEYPSSLASVRFVYPSWENDSTVYSFALHPDVSSDIVKIPVKLIGYASASDRDINIVPVAESSTARQGSDYTIERAVIAAQAYADSIAIRVNKTDALNNGDLVATFRLEANGSFADAPINYAQFRLVLTNKLSEPTGWPFGDYSVIKHQFVIQVIGIATGYENWSTSDAIRYRRILTEALYEYNKAHPDNPLRDENGLLISFA